VLHLHAGVHLHEVVLVVLCVHEELHRARVDVVDALAQPHRVRRQPVARLLGQVQRRRDLDDLLVPPLHRAVPLEQVHDVAVAVRKDLRRSGSRAEHSRAQQSRVEQSLSVRCTTHTVRRSDVERSDGTQLLYTIDSTPRRQTTPAHLHFDVPGVLHVLLQEHGALADSCLGFGLAAVRMARNRTYM
jgi:hypothetical protein